MMLDVSYNIARTTDLQVTKGFGYTPSTFYAGGLQPNTAPNALLSSKINNPFAIFNFGGVASMQKSLFLKHALVVTMDRDRREFQGAHVHILDGKIHDLGVNLPT
jgi:hypothetical protein